MPKITNRQVPAKIGARLPFEANSVRAFAGEWLTRSFGFAYHLTAEQKAEIEASAYVVYSYGTPIAWQLADGTLYLDDHKYSVTTSRHQSLVRQGMTGTEFDAHKAQNPKAWK